MLTIYTYAQCGTCRKATQWLRAQGLAFHERPIRETPPTVAELRAVLAARGGDLRRLCNTSGRDYRDLQLGNRLPALSAAEVLRLLSGNGNLVKRPLLCGPGVALAGFNQDEWRAALAG